MGRPGSGDTANPEPARLGEKLRQGLAHAFAIESADGTLPAEEQAVVDQVAQGVVRRGMSTPAIMLLESVRPLHFVGSQALAFFEPLASAVLDPAKCQTFRRVLERPRGIPQLIASIERCAAASETSPEAPGESAGPDHG